MLGGSLRQFSKQIKNGVLQRYKANIVLYEMPSLQPLWKGYEFLGILEIRQ